MGLLSRTLAPTRSDIDLASWQSRGLIYVIAPFGLEPRDIVAGVRVGYRGAPTAQFSVNPRMSIGCALDGSNEAIEVALPSNWQTTTEFTLVSAVTWLGSPLGGNTTIAGNAIDNTDTTPWSAGQIYRSVSTGYVNFSWNYNFGTTYAEITSTTNPSTNTAHWYVATFAQGSQCLYEDGVLIASGSNSHTISYRASALLSIGSYTGTSGRTANFILHETRAYRQAWTRAQVQMHYADPWGLYRTPKPFARRVFTLPSSNVVSTPGAATLLLSTYAPTVTATNHQTATPGVASLTLTAYAPTVTASDHKTATPGVASLTTTAYAPTVTATDHQTATPGVASLTLSTYAPTVTASGNQTATPDVASLTTTAYAPTVTATNHQTATPSTASLTITAYAPSVGQPQQVTPSTASLTTTAYAPTVSTTANQTATPSTVAVVLTAYAPTVTATAHQTVTIGVLALVLTRYAPTVAVYSSTAVTIRATLSATYPVVTFAAAMPVVRFTAGTPSVTFTVIGQA